MYITFWLPRIFETAHVTLGSLHKGSGSWICLSIGLEAPLLCSMKLIDQLPLSLVSLIWSGILGRISISLYSGVGDETRLS